MAKASDKKLMIIMIILFVMAIGVMGVLCIYQYDGNQSLSDKIIEVNNEIKGQEDRVKKIPGLEKERKNVVEAIGDLTEILPSESVAAHAKFLDLLRQFAEDAEIRVEALTVVAEGIDPDPDVPIKKYKYNIVAKGSFPKFVLFLNLIEKHTRFLKVDSFEVSNKQVGPDYWPETEEKKITLQLSTYTYKLD